MNRALVHILMTLFLTTALTGCEPQARHRALTFFFTGVPPLDETRPVEEIKDQSPSALIPDKTDMSPQILFSHPVWAAGVCDTCHESAGTYNIFGIKKKSTVVFKTGGGMPGKLILPKNVICGQCHMDKTTARALVENLWLHDTAAKGDCLACHDPHQSQNPKTLRQPSVILCLPCHKEGKFLLTPAHQKEEECLSCHNPHMGINKNLLTKEYKEVKKPVTHVPGHPELVQEQHLPAKDALPGTLKTETGENSASDGEDR